MSSIGRSHAPTGSSRPLRAFALLIGLCAAFGFSARGATAQTAPNFWLAGTSLIFSRPEQHGAETAVAHDDPGLVRFLNKLGATLSYDPDQRYLIVTSADRRTIIFNIGDSRYSNGDAHENAAFAPYRLGPSVYLPFLALAKALYVLPVADRNVTVLQPQIGALDVRTVGNVTTVTLRGALPLQVAPRTGSGNELVFTVRGAATTLEPQRRLGSAALHALSFQTSGSTRNPTTTVVFDVAPGAEHALSGGDLPNEVAFKFAPAGVALGAPATPQSEQYAPLPVEVPPAQAPTPPPLGPPVQVTSVDLLAADETLSVRIGVSAPVTYEWHRLSDNRWFVDLDNAVLATPGRDELPQTSAVQAVRIRQLQQAPDPIVRIALTLPSPRRIDVVPAPGGFAVAVDAMDDPQAARSGSGRIASGVVIAAATPAPAQSDLWSTPAVAPSHAPAPTNPKLIVIDPGHGGSDSGAVHNGLTEKDITLDISKRLRAILLARGWEVKMTREVDTDVYKPDDSARDELQARCDIANGAGARFFVSIHVNSFTSSALDGTTTYYYKPADQQFAEAIHRRLAASAGTVDRGLRKEEFYVIHHTDMPATLIETAFLSNPGDAELLRSPAFLQRIAIAIADGIGDYAANSPVVNPTGGS